MDSREIALPNSIIAYESWGRLPKLQCSSLVITIWRQKPLVDLGADVLQRDRLQILYN